MGVPVLETERLTLRGFLPDDVDAFSLVLADKEKMWDLWAIPGFPEDLLDHAGLYVTKSIESWQNSGFGLWAVLTRAPKLSENVELIGFSGFVSDFISTIQPPEGLEVGWGLRPDFHGRGLAIEAATAVVNYGFGNFGVPKLIAITSPNNTPSRKLMERLGFSFTKMVTAYGESCVLYSLSREAFENKPPA